MNAYARTRDREEPKVFKTEASKENVRRMRELARMNHAEFRRNEQKGAAVEMPLSPEQRDDLRLMLALPDRGDVTFEEREYRSKQAAKLED